MRKASGRRRGSACFPSHESRSSDQRELLHQQHRTAALYFARDFPVHVCGHPSNSTRQNFAALRDKFLQEIRVLVIYCLHGDIDPSARHGPIGAAKCGTAFWSFRLHRLLLSFPVQGAPPQKRIVFFLLQAIRCPWTFLIALRHVARRRLTECFSFGAFEGNNFLGHELGSLLHFRRSGFLLLGFRAFLLGQTKQRRN